MLQKKLTLLILVLFFVSCSTTPKKEEAPKTYAPRATEKALKDYREAVALYKSKNHSESLKKLGRFIKIYPRVDITDDAYYLIGQIYYDKNNFFKAAQFWQAIIDSPLISEYHDRAAVGAALCYYQLGHHEDSLKSLEKYNFPPPIQENALAAQAFELSSKIKLIRKQTVSALRDLISAMGYRRSASDIKALEFKANDIVKSYFNQDQLNDIVGDANFEKVDAAARLKLGILLYDQKSWTQAGIQFQIIKEKYALSEEAKKASEYLALIDSQNKVDVSAIGVVLPLTGKSSTHGYRVLRGIQLATNLFGSSRYKLAIVDSEGNPDIAKKAVDRLVSEDHVIAIIGDVAGKTSQAVAQRAQELGVPCLTLSQKQGLTSLGEFVFRNNVTPDMQMKTLVHQAMTINGHKRFAILFPNDTYGTEYATAFWDYVLLNGGEIVAAQSYAPEETDFREPIQRLVGTFYLEEDRGKELAIRLNEWKKEQKPKTAREKPPKDLMPPVVDFDALFIPDGPKSLGQISSMLVYNEISNITLLGTNLWNSSQTASRAGLFAENILFVDEPSVSASSFKDFASDFQPVFGYAPSASEAQGYDSALIIINALNSAQSRKSMRDAVSSVSKISGAGTLISMGPNREVEKSLFPLTIKAGQIVKASN
ncbi:MAG: penicillin-binding protein activator [Oligoflexia bacterium]|nr:penicillin-binding protein activator [Oligoflexia bacterium]